MSRNVSSEIPHKILSSTFKLQTQAARNCHLVECVFAILSIKFIVNCFHTLSYWWPAANTEQTDQIKNIFKILNSFVFFVKVPKEKEKNENKIKNVWAMNFIISTAIWH